MCDKSVSATVTKIILSIVAILLSDGFLIKEIWRVSCKILYFLLSCPITRSTCMRTHASLRDISISSLDNCSECRDL